MQIYVRQGCPWSSPGFHFGISLSTRKASRSSSGLADFTTLRSAIVPSLLTMNDTKTVPCRLARCAAKGYFRFFVSHWTKADMPPGNSGRRSTTWKFRGLSASPLTAVGCKVTSETAAMSPKPTPSSFFNAALSESGLPASSRHVAARTVRCITTPLRGQAMDTTFPGKRERGSFCRQT